MSLNVPADLISQMRSKRIPVAIIVVEESSSSDEFCGMLTLMSGTGKDEIAIMHVMRKTGDGSYSEWGSAYVGEGPPADMIGAAVYKGAAIPLDEDEEEWAAPTIRVRALESGEVAVAFEMTAVTPLSGDPEQ